MLCSHSTCSIIEDRFISSKPSSLDLTLPHCILFGHPSHFMSEANVNLLHSSPSRISSTLPFEGAGPWSEFYHGCLGTCLQAFPPLDISPHSAMIAHSSSSTPTSSTPQGILSFSYHPARLLVSAPPCKRQECTLHQAATLHSK